MKHTVSHQTLLLYSTDNLSLVDIIPDYLNGGFSVKEKWRGHFQYLSATVSVFSAQYLTLWITYFKDYWMLSWELLINPLSAKLTKWPNTLKQFVGNLPTNCLSVFGHFMGLALKGLTEHCFPYFMNFDYVPKFLSFIHCAK